MIVRIWHGRTKAADADRYREYVIRTGIKDLISTKGNLGVQIWQTHEKDISHIRVVSWWENIESIKSFAGDEYQKARYYEEDKLYLLEFEPEVKHYHAWDFKPDL